MTSRQIVLNQLIVVPEPPLFFSQLGFGNDFSLLVDKLRSGIISIGSTLTGIHRGSRQFLPDIRQ